MRHFICVIAICLGGVAWAQSEDEVASARLLYLDGNYTEALKVLIPAAEAGNANAQNVLGDAYLDGLGVEQDIAKTEEWWKKSAAQGFAKALYNVGWAYDKGRFASGPDAQKARAFYERAMAQDYHFAFNNLGRMYEDSRFSSEPDYEQAADLYQRAVDLGNIDALNNLGRAYVFGRGVPERLDTAMELFRRAADAGDPTGFNNLGAMYANGYSVSKDSYAAAGLYAIAARLGYAQAAVNLAFVLIDSPKSGLHDPATGWGWCLIALDRADAPDLEALQGDCDYLQERVGDEDQAAGRAFAAAELGE